MTKSDFARSLGVPPSTITEACKAGKLLEAALVEVPGRKRRQVDANHPAAVKYAKRHEGNPPIDGPEPKAPRSGRPKAGDARARDARRFAKAGAKRAGKKAGRAVAAAVKGRAPRKEYEPGRDAINEIRLDMPPVDILDAKIAHAPESLRALLDMTIEQVLRGYGSVGDLIDVLKSTKMMTDIEASRLKISERRGELVERELIKVHVFGPIAETLLRILADAPRTITVRTRALVESEASNEDVEATVRKLLEKEFADLKKRLTRALKKAAPRDEVAA